MFLNKECREKVVAKLKEKTGLEWTSTDKGFVCKKTLDASVNASNISSLFRSDLVEKTTYPTLTAQIAKELGSFPFKGAALITHRAP
ncbi:MAG: hypothetical protein ACRCXC_01130 [Legionella sp.]